MKNCNLLFINQYFQTFPIPGSIVDHTNVKLTVFIEHSYHNDISGMSFMVIHLKGLKFWSSTFLTFVTFFHVLEKVLKNMHRPGIEPGSIAWQATILPLNHRCLVRANFMIVLCITKKMLPATLFLLARHHNVNPLKLKSSET